MAIPKGRVLTGARARFMIEGKRVGYATDVSFTEEIQFEEVDELDNIEAVEFVPVGYRVRFTASIVRIVGHSLKALSIFPRVENILTSGVLTVAIEDPVTGQIILTLEQVKAENYNYNIPARGIAVQNVQFNAIRARDESEVT